METAVDETKFMHGSVDFPILFQNYGMVVYKNPSGEIFVQNKVSKVQMRLTYVGRGLVFTTEDLVEPTRVTNMIGWKITPR